MRNFYLGVMLILLTGCGSSSPKFRDTPVFLVAGQSNSISKADQHPDHYSTTGAVTINDYYHQGGFFVPTQINPSRAGVSWIYAGDLLNRTVTFHMVGEGGTNTNMWVGKETPYIGDAALYFRIQNALSERVYDAVLWVQGESDIVNSVSEEATYENMKFIIAKSHEINPFVPWIVALDSMTGEPEDNHVRRAQKRIIAEGLALQGPDLDFLHNHVDYSGGTVGGGDFVGEGLKIHGSLWYQTLKQYF